jgi:hypothetical protein
MCIFDVKPIRMFLKKVHVVMFLLLIVSQACQQPWPQSSLSEVQQTIDSLKHEYAPDRRVAIFDIALEEGNGTAALTGETDQPKAYQALKELLVKKALTMVDSVTILPQASLGDTVQAVISISVANLRSQPKHSAELATQAILGTPVKVLKKEGGWYYIQTPDHYLAWVDNGGLAVMEKERFAQWQAMDKIMYTNTYGHAYLSEEGTQRISDLVAGNVLGLLEKGAEHYHVTFPDGRNAYVRRSEAMSYGEWLNGLNPTPENLVATSKSLMGIPYLWGGTSTKGADCSGFTKTVYFLNGLILPRDASQQVHAGTPIDSIGDFSQLQAGDLLFFGRKATDSTKEKVVHVGMWMGNNRFIHASEQVRISSMDENSPEYDAFNKNRYLRTKRMLRDGDERLIDLAQTPLFMN